MSNLEKLCEKFKDYVKRYFAGDEDLNYDVDQFIKDIKLEFKLKEEEFEELEAKLEERDDDIRDLRSSLEEAEDKASSYEDQYNEADVTCSDLRDTIAELEEKLSDFIGFEREV